MWYVTELSSSIFPSNWFSKTNTLRVTINNIKLDAA